MKLVPASLGGRLLLGAAVFVAAALAAASILIGFILHHFVTGQIEQRLDTQIAAIVGALKADEAGSLRLATDLDGPPFDRLASGWYWQVTGAGQPLKSRSLGAASLDAPPRPFDWRHLFSDRAASAKAPDAQGQMLHIRVRQASLEGRSITVTASAPQAAIDGPMRQALLSLVGSLVALWIGLMLATLVQIRMGLRPLRRLRDAMMRIRSGELQHVPSDQPTELHPLVTELNGLIDQNAAGLASARRHVSNLAHGLKTPLASLSIELQEAGRDPSGSMKELVDQIEHRVRHHLGRARAAAGASRPSRTLLAPRLTDIAAVMARVHADRGICFLEEIDDGLTVACEPQDLDEMLGNLLDNGFKWARTTVRASVEIRNADVAISIDDDGPGLADAQMMEALLPGRRLDESVPGHGFGLPITRELAELYGGTVLLCRGPLGGLRATIALPSR